MLLSQFSAIFDNFRLKKLAFFSKNQCYDNFFAKISSSLSKKRQFFSKFFGENILKIITSVPVHPGCVSTEFFLRKKSFYFSTAISREILKRALCTAAKVGHQSYKSGGRCYDRNFRDFCQFSAKKLAFFYI
jgi:hypothetical protein